MYLAGNQIDLLCLPVSGTDIPMAGTGVPLGGDWYPSWRTGKVRPLYAALLDSLLDSI